MEAIRNYAERAVIGTDVLGFYSGFGQFKVVDQFFAFDIALARQTEREVYNYGNRSAQERRYMSIFYHK